ncbi:hypothetical protein [Streptomyces sp. 135]|uniref:hypothetical protein n=1 Tax=Streptomyces sp. 135 TaxID=2838850 RepID=UPI001CBAFE63|nr:hypothetical protein [Streptomyces sp. 135]
MRRPPPPGPTRAPPTRPSLPPPPATDVCALGEAYGGWRPGSPESDICRNVYGR